MRPRLILIGGPNGAGKTTFARVLAPRIGARFVNADDIAREIAPEDPASSAVAAGRRALATSAEALVEGADVAVETTLAGHAHLRLVERARARGYEVRLVFLYLASPELALLRVAGRVRMGGHDIPEEVVRRRYSAGLRNLFEVYRGAVDGWYLYDTSEGNPVAVAVEENGMLTVLDERRYEQIRAAAEDAHNA
jgi:predicted ABC-type ATPase